MRFGRPAQPDAPAIPAPAAPQGVGTQVVAPSPPPGPPPPPSPEPRRKRHPIAWTALGTFAVLTGLAVVASMHQGVDTISFRDGSISFKGKTSAQARAEIGDQQGELQSRAAANHTQAQALGANTVAPDDFSGTWQGSNGYSYVIDQYGERLVLREVSPYGTTAVGQGQFVGSNAIVSFQAINGVTGQAGIERVDGSSLHAVFQNSLGQQTEVMLRGP